MALTPKTRKIIKNTMIFYNFSTLNKRLNLLRGKLKNLLLLANKKTLKAFARKYIINILEIEQKIKHLERVARSFGLKSEEIQDFRGRTCYRVQSRTKPEEWHTVRLWEANPKNRCDCGDCNYRGARCLHQIHAQRISRQNQFLQKLNLFKKVEEKPQVLVEEIDITTYKVLEEDKSFTVHPKALNPLWRCTCDKASLFGGECGHQQAVADFKKQQFHAFQAEIFKNQEAQKQQFAADNKRRTQEREAAWRIRLEVLESILKEDLIKAGLEVLYAHRDHFLSILTDKGLIICQESGWSIRTKEGQHLKCENMDKAIALLENPLLQFT